MKKIVIEITEDEITNTPNDASLGKKVRNKYLKEKRKEEEYEQYNWVHPGPKE
jgi:hypothetical protein